MSADEFLQIVFWFGVGWIIAVNLPGILSLLVALWVLVFG